MPRTPSTRRGAHAKELALAELEIVDIHTHTFASADRGVAWQRSTGRTDVTRNGTIEELTGIMAGATITHAVQLMYTPTRFMVEARLKSQELPSDPAERDAVVREVREETGIVVTAPRFLFSLPNRYIYHSFNYSTVDIFFECRIEAPPAFVPNDEAEIGRAHV